MTVAAPLPSLSVVIPMYNEADSVLPMLAGVHDGLAAYRGPWELICVDDGSRDATARLLHQEAQRYGGHVRVLSHRRNFGQTAAMQTGIDAARGEVIATLDGDLQNDPADIPRMVEEMLAKDLDLLAGWRRQRHDQATRKLFSRVANRLIGRVTGVHLHDYGCSLKVYRTEVIKDVALYGEMHRFIPVWMAMVTSPARMQETVVNHRPRQFGASKYGLSRTFRVILDLLSAFFFLRYRTRPGHFFGSIGLALGALGGVIMVYLAVVKLALGESIGSRPLLFIGILLLVASVQFLTTGVLAEMLSRTLLATSDRSTHPLVRRDSGALEEWHLPG
jgi:glycosyltransferase involved in cell wall biosynthesis